MGGLGSTLAAVNATRVLIQNGIDVDEGRKLFDFVIPESSIPSLARVIRGAMRFQESPGEAVHGRRAS